LLDFKLLRSRLKPLSSRLGLAPRQIRTAYLRTLPNIVFSEAFLITYSVVKDRQPLSGLCRNFSAQCPLRLSAQVQAPIQKDLLTFQDPPSQLKLVEVRGLEPLTSGLQSPRSAKLSYTPI
jgi:hypothetical protein